MASTSRELILIGLCDGDLDPKKYRSSYLTNKVGGQPDWLPDISGHCPPCGRCGARLAHVVQVYCPLEASLYHRNLHLFACPGSDCSGRSECWRALRSQCLETKVAAEPAPSKSVPAQEPPLSASDWCDSADDWGMEERDDGWVHTPCVKQNRAVQDEAAAPETEEGSAPSAMDVSNRLRDLSLSKSLMEEIPIFRAFFISVVEESDLCGEGAADLEHAQELLREYERREGVAVGELDGSEGFSSGGEEKYEKTRAKHGDADFSRFMKKISLCPQQILRYCRGGKPLFISEPSSNMAQVVSACDSCGGPRTFELQLMPALVSVLQTKDSSMELEFGTVLVYTCSNSCWEAGSGSTMEELCFVQTDPDQQLFK